jgi:hypothetical protein
MTFYYLFTVGVEDIHSKNAGKFYLDTFLTYTEKERQNVLDAQSASKNELIPLSPQESLEMFNVFNLNAQMNAMAIRSVFQNTTTCLCHSDFEMSRDDIDIIVRTSTLEDIQKMSTSVKKIREGGEI